VLESRPAVAAIVAARNAVVPPVEPGPDSAVVRETRPPASAEDVTLSWPDEAAESSFLAEARGRGETVVAVKPQENPDDSDPQSMPALDELVQRIPAEVRATLDDLFRAKFTKVRRIPRNALKN